MISKLLLTTYHVEICVKFLSILVFSYIDVVVGPPEPLAARPSVSGGDGCVTVAWSSPTYDGGCKLTGYRLEMRTADSSEWSVVADRSADSNLTLSV